MKNLCVIYTGTVASTLYPKIESVFKSDGYNTTNVFTEKSGYFLHQNSEGFDNKSEWGSFLCGDKYKKGELIPHIKGHSTSMLHIELYPHGQKKASNTYDKDKDILRDPTQYLVEAAGQNVIKLGKE